MAKKLTLVLSLLTLMMVLLTILQDSLYASFNTTGFYLSESLLFTSFWWIFLPFLYFQHRLVLWRQPKTFQLILLMIVPMVLHFIVFPYVVWLISKLFFGHAFRFGQTLQYALSSYLYVVLLVYSVPLVLFIYLNKRLAAKELQSPGQELSPAFTKSIAVTEGSRIRNLAVDDILYISANTPYINLWTSGKKYLYNETLKSIGTKLDPDHFVRIHKSTIVNLREVETYKSRLNGDFDLTLRNGTELRVSRNYITDFKNRYHGHRLGVI